MWKECELVTMSNRWKRKIASGKSKECQTRTCDCDSRCTNACTCVCLCLHLLFCARARVCVCVCDCASVCVLNGVCCSVFIFLWQINAVKHSSKPFAMTPGRLCWLLSALAMTLSVQFVIADSTVACRRHCRKNTPYYVTCTYTVSALRF